MSRIFLCSSTPNDIISTPQAISISQLDRTLQNPIYLATEIKPIRKMKRSANQIRGYLKQVILPKTNLFLKR